MAKKRLSKRKEPMLDDYDNDNGKYGKQYAETISRALANEQAETNRLLRIFIYCYLKTHLQISDSLKELEDESLELLEDKTLVTDGISKEKA